MQVSNNKPCWLIRNAARAQMSIVDRNVWRAARRSPMPLIGGAAISWPLIARAQQPAKMKRIAYVNSAGNVSRISVSGHPYYRAFFEELSRLGYVEGQNLGVERYSGEGRTRYAELARD